MYRPAQEIKNRHRRRHKKTKQWLPMRTKRHSHTQPIITARHRQTRTNQLRQPLTHHTATTIQPMSNLTVHARTQGHHSSNTTRDRIKKSTHTAQALLKQSRRRRTKQFPRRLHTRLSIRTRQPTMLTSTNEQICYQHIKRPHTWPTRITRPTY